MKIRILTPEYPPTFGGGVATFYQALAPQFAAAGHSVEVVQGSAVFCSSGSAKGRRDGVDIYTLEEARLRKHFTRFAHFTPISGAARHLAAAWAMWEKSEELGDADIVEGCDWGLSFIPAVLSQRQPVVAQMHGSVGQINRHDPIAGEEAAGVAIRLMEVAALQRAAEIQTYSKANARFWSGQTGRPTMHIAPAWRMPSELVAAAPLSSSGLVLGRVQEWKGPQVLCDALLRLGRAAPSVDWVGRDTVSRRLDRSASKSLAHDHPHIWGSRVRHVPQVAPAEAWRLQCQARFIVVPSTWDVFNFTCIEAMASGRPVICSSGAGASELDRRRRQRLSVSQRRRRRPRLCDRPRAGVDRDAGRGDGRSGASDLGAKARPRACRGVAIATLRPHRRPLQAQTGGRRRLAVGGVLGA